MIIERIIDIEEEIRAALTEYIQSYVKPLPKDFIVPSIEITSVGGTENNEINIFDVTFDSRAADEYTAQLNLRNAIGIIEAIAENQTTAVRHVSVNTLATWGRDPVRPELAMCTARLKVVAHKETVEVNKHD